MTAGEDTNAFQGERQGSQNEQELNSKNSDIAPRERLSPNESIKTPCGPSSDRKDNVPHGLSSTNQQVNKEEEYLISIMCT